MIVEPLLNIQQTISPTQPLLGEVVTVVMTVEHDDTSVADAHEVELTDLLPPALNYVEGSLLWSGTGIAPTAMQVMTTTVENPGGIEPIDLITHEARVDWDTLPAGAISQVQFQARVSHTYLPPSLEPETV